MARTAVVLTSYCRPRLVRDAIASVLNQTDQDFRLYIMDDGSNAETVRAIQDAVSGEPLVAYCMMDPIRGKYRLVKSPAVEGAGDFKVMVWRGADRSQEDRKATISYSRTINCALNMLLVDEQYVTYVCDDDALYPESVGARADYLDKHPNVHVVFGRSRSIQYNAEGGYNTWDSAGDPQPGIAFPRPTGRRELMNDGASARCYFDNGETDPQTGLDFVEEAFWRDGFNFYGRPFKADHNQLMHRRECLSRCRKWPDGAILGGVQYWGEDPSWGVGDAAFFTLLGECHAFMGVDAWVCSKKFHARSHGCVTGEVRE